MTHRIAVGEREFDRPGMLTQYEGNLNHVALLGGPGRTLDGAMVHNRGLAAHHNAAVLLEWMYLKRDPGIALAFEAIHVEGVQRRGLCPTINAR